MKDQVESLRKKNVTAVYIRETTGNEQLTEEVCMLATIRCFFFLFFAQKDLTWRDMCQSAYYRENLVGFVTDEARCVKM